MADPQGAERRAVEDGRMTRPAFEHHGVVRNDAVEKEPVGALVVEHTVADRREQPGAARAEAGCCGERARDLEQAAVPGRRRQLGAPQLRAGMGVSVVETGDDSAAADIAHPGARPRQAAQRVRRADGDDARAPDRERLGPGPHWVRGEDAAAGEDQLRRSRPPPGAGGERERRESHRRQPAHQVG